MYSFTLGLHTLLSCRALQVNCVAMRQQLLPSQRWQVRLGRTSWQLARCHDHRRKMKSSVKQRPQWWLNSPPPPFSFACCSGNQTKHKTNCNSCLTHRVLDLTYLNQSCTDRGVGGRNPSQQINAELFYEMEGNLQSSLFNPVCLLEKPPPLLEKEAEGGEKGKDRFPQALSFRGQR